MAPNPTSESLPLEKNTSLFQHRTNSMGKGKPEVSRCEEDENNNNGEEQLKKEILFDGWYYDVTDFIRRHPGGSVIDYYTKPGEDATAAIQQFHHRSSKKVMGIMKSFKRRPAEENEELPARNKALTEDFTKLYLELEREGMFKPCYSHIAYRIAEIFALAAAGYYCTVVASSYIVFIAGCFFLGMAQGRSGWIMHEGGHYSLTGNPKVDRFLQTVVGGVGAGVSASWWRRGHSRHHAMPQRLKHDIDLDTLPFLVYNVKVIEDNPGRGHTFLVRNQKYLFLAMDASLGLLAWQLYMNPKYSFKYRKYLELACQCVRYYLFSYVGFWPWFISDWLVGIYVFLNFSLSHSHLPVTNEPTHWVEYALTHTADIEQKPWCDWWMAYLNYQIEHHLFPTMPQFRGSKIAPRVKALADKHGIPYYVMGYKEAVITTLRNMGHVADELQKMK